MLRNKDKVAGESENALISCLRGRMEAGNDDAINESDEGLRSKMKLQTLVFIVQDGKVLLGLKKRGFGVGKWNGYGGKIEQIETPKGCACRELFEESNLVVDETDVEYLGFVQFKIGGRVERKVHVYTCHNYTGVVRETEEMRPEWFNIREVPYREMWEDSYFWMPFVFRNVRFEATFELEDDLVMRSIHIDLKG